MGIESIALQTGFNGVTCFDRVFRKITGISPQAYRKSVAGRKGQH